MKTSLAILLVSASLAFSQTRTVTVDGSGALVSPQPQAFATANDLPRLSGNNTFSADNAFSGGIKAGDLHLVEALNEIFAITINGTAPGLNASGVELYTDFGDTIRVVEDMGAFFWSDETGYGWYGRSGPWNTAEEGATALKNFVSNFDPNWNAEYPYQVSGSGTQVTVTVEGRDISDWGSNNADLLLVASSQQGRQGGWEGSGALISQSGNITLSGTIISLSTPPSPPLLITDSDSATSVTENWNAQGFAMSGQSYPLIGMWTSPGQQSMAIGFGGRPATNGDNLGARPWHAVNSSYVGRMTYLGSEGNFDIPSTRANTWELGDWNLMRSWAFLYAGSFVAGDSTPGGFSSRLIYFDGVEPASRNPGAYYWRPLSAAMWNADIGTNKRELRVKFFGAPAGGYGNRDALATRVIASTEWTASRWRGTGTSDPATPQDGDLFFRSDTTKVRIYASGSWRDLN